METVKLISMAKIFVGDVDRARSPTSASSSTAAGATSRSSTIARAWRDQRLLRIGGGTTETMRYYVAKLMGL